MTRIRFLLLLCLSLLFAGQVGYTGPQKIQKKNSKPDIKIPDTKLVVPSWTDNRDTLPMDLMQLVYATPPPAIPMEDALREPPQKNQKKVVIVPTPPPSPAPSYIPPKTPGQKRD